MSPNVLKLAVIGYLLCSFIGRYRKKFSCFEFQRKLLEKISEIFLGKEDFLSKVI